MPKAGMRRASNGNNIARMYNVHTYIHYVCTREEVNKLRHRGVYDLDYTKLVTLSIHTGLNVNWIHVDPSELCNLRMPNEAPLNL